MIALLAGASPLILSFIFLLAKRISTTYPDKGWVEALVQHQDDIIQTLIVSSLMVAVFSTVLRFKVASVAAGFQPGLIQVMFILTDLNRSIILNIPLAAITVLPLLILLLTLRRDIDKPDDQEKDEKIH